MYKHTNLIIRSHHDVIFPYFFQMRNDLIGNLEKIPNLQKDTTVTAAAHSPPNIWGFAPWFQVAPTFQQRYQPPSIFERIRDPFFKRKWIVWTKHSNFRCYVSLFLGGAKKQAACFFPIS